MMSKALEPSRPWLVDSLFFLATLWAVPLHAQEAKPEKAETPQVPIAEQIAKLDVELKTNGEAAQKNRLELAELQRQQFDLNLKLKHLESQLQTLDKTQLEGRQKIEKLLTDSGQWISFSQKIAPILRDHCLTCHNPRNPQGQYIVATYANLVGNGESGPAVAPGEAEKSPLYKLTADHSMPQDSSPLSAEQVELIKRWIDAGARLDSGAQRDDSIFRLAPRGEQVQPPEHYPAPIPISAVAVSTNGELIATSGYYEVLLWSANDGMLVSRIPGVAQRVHAIEFLSDGKRIAVASGTPGRVGEARVFDLTNGQPIADLLFCQDSALCLAGSPDGKHLAVGETSGAITVFAVQEKSFDQLYRIEDHSDWTTGLSWSRDSKWIVSASRDKTSKVFDASNGKSKITFNGHEQPVLSVSFADDNQHVISVGEDHRLRIWNISEAKQIHDLKEFDSPSWLLRFDEKHCLVVGTERKAVLVEVSAGKKGKKFDFSAPLVSSAALNTNRTRAYLGTYQGKLHSIDLSDAGTEIVFQATP
ncbi:MAG: c-type cytochrome domain-containing protein [Pirellulales bacterium]